MSVWSRTLIYLGLREEPDDALDWQVVDDQGGAPEQQRPTATMPPVSAAPLASRAPSEAPTNVRPLRQAIDVSSERVTVVQVRVFEDVETIGSRYRQRHPVLFDVSATTREVARRTVDFVSGLTYASRGTLRRTAPRAFLLVPEGVEVARDEQRRLAQLGYDVDGDA
jgi:FtsZ-interacting cell division protein YlmF